MTARGITSFMLVKSELSDLKMYVFLYGQLHGKSQLEDDYLMKLLKEKIASICLDLLNKKLGSVCIDMSWMFIRCP